MTMSVLSIAAAGGSALLRRIDLAAAALARVAVPTEPRLGRSADGLLTVNGEVVDPPVRVPSFVTTLSVGPDGLVSGLDPQSPEMPMPIGQIAVAPAPQDHMTALMDLLALQRAFELNNKVIQAADDILQGINSLRRKA